MPQPKPEVAQSGGFGDIEKTRFSFVAKKRVPPEVGQVEIEITVSLKVDERRGRFCTCDRVVIESTVMHYVPNTICQIGNKRIYWGIFPKHKDRSRGGPYILIVGQGG